MKANLWRWTWIRSLAFLGNQAAKPDGGEEYIAVYADEEVTYGALVKVLDLGAQNNLKMVLATKPAPFTSGSSAASRYHPIKIRSVKQLP